MIINSILKGHTVYYLFVYYLTLLKVTNALELCHSSLELSSPNRYLAAIRLGGTRHRKKRKERIGGGNLEVAKRVARAGRGSGSPRK